MCYSSFFLIFSNVVSLIALLIAALSFWMQYRNKLTVSIDPKILFLPPQNIYLDGISDQFDGVVGFFKTQIDVVNYSSHDIAFFDLRVFNPKNNYNHQFISKKTFPHNMSSDTKISINDGVCSYEYNVEVPDKKYGVFKAHSLTHFDIIIYDFDKEAFEDSIMLSFKISKKNWIRKDPFAVTNREKFKMYCEKYDINGWGEMLQNDLANKEHNISNIPHEQEY